MTPEQIRDFYALSSTPTITVSAGIVVWIDTAGLITGWAAGGGQQMFLAGRISADSYVYQRAIGANALWYAPYLATTPASWGRTSTTCPK